VRPDDSAAREDPPEGRGGARGREDDQVGGLETAALADAEVLAERRSAAVRSRGGLTVAPALHDQRRGLMTPLGLKLTADDGQPVPADSFAFAQAVGERAADAALEALAQAKPSVSSALEHRSATVFVPLENRLFRLATFLGVLDRELFSEGRPATSLFGDDLRTEVGYPRIGDAEALLVPSEIYPELVLGGIQEPQDPGADFPGAPRERSLFSLLSSEYRLVVGLANDEIGYVIPRSQWNATKPFAYRPRLGGPWRSGSSPGRRPLLREPGPALPPLRPSFSLTAAGRRTRIREGDPHVASARLRTRG
jgi:hypothetical protein